jgi:hypothetical protein
MNAADADLRYQYAVQHLRTYNGFLVGMRFVVAHAVVVLSFLILAFCTGAGIWGGAFVALVLLVAGVYFAKDRRRIGWASEVGTLVMTTAYESGHVIEDEYRAEGLPVPDHVGDGPLLDEGVRSADIMTTRP